MQHELDFGEGTSNCLKNLFIEESHTAVVYDVDLEIQLFCQHFQEAYVRCCEYFLVVCSIVTF